METIDLLKNNVLSTPQTLFNIGVGPRQHNEAKSFKELWPEIDIIGLEPNTNTFIDRIVDYPGKLYPWGIWSTSMIKEFKAVLKVSGKSSLLTPHKKWQGQWSYTPKECQNILISCITLDQLDKALNFPKDIFLWMDIEGSELEAIRGGSLLLSSGRVKWIDMEVSHNPRRIGEPNENILAEALKPYHFSLKCKYNSGKAIHNSLYVID